MKNILLALTLMIVSTSCSNFHIEKRRYNRGFHISYAKKFPSTKTVNEREEVSSNPTDATNANTIGEELIQAKHPKMVDAIRENTEPTPQVAQAEVLVEADANWNREVVSNQIGSKPFTATHLHQKTKKSITSSTIEHMTIGRGRSNVNAMASAASRPFLGNGEGWTILISLLSLLLLLVVLYAIFAGTAAGKVLLIALIVTGSLTAAIVLAVLIFFLYFALTFRT